MEGDGRATVYAGGWSDYVAQRGGMPDFGPKAEGSKPKSAATPQEPAKAVVKTGLSFTERHRLDALPGEIGRLEAEIGKLSDLLAQPNLYSEAPAKFAKATEALAERQARLSAAEEEWLALEEKAEA